MRLQPIPSSAVEITAPQSAGTLEQRFILFGGAALLLLLALLLPEYAQTAHYHAFADQRSFAGLPHGADVLSNLGFVLMGVLGLRALWQADNCRVNGTARAMCALFFAGLLCTAVGSTYYHWAPQDASLVWDRLGMSVAFAGLLGLAVQTRLDDTSASVAALIMLVAAPLSVAVWAQTGNVLPWALVQFGGVALVVVLVFVKPVPGAMGVSIGLTIALYALAKVFEHFDAQVYALTGEVLSGHSLKHLVASLAAWPVLAAVWRASALVSARAQGRPGTL